MFVNHKCAYSCCNSHQVTAKKRLYGSARVPVGGNEKDISDTDGESEDDGADIADLAEGELTIRPVRLM